MLVGVVAVCRLCCGVVFRKHRGETMKSFGVLATLISAAALAGMTGTASAQTQGSTAQHVQLQKTIGHGKPDIVPSLIVMNSRGATLQGGKLVLTGMSPNSIIFADRPVRSAGHDLTSRIIEDWGVGADNFAKDPPNATVSGFSKDGSGIRDAVVVLKSPKLEGDKLTFDVEVLEGDLNGADGPASVFIDLIGRPFTPLSYAGVARRTAYRGAFYAGAATAGAVAAGAVAAGAAAAYAAPYAAPYGYAPPPPAYYAPRCGYYPLPPCY